MLLWLAEVLPRQSRVVAAATLFLCWFGMFLFLVCFLVCFPTFLLYCKTCRGKGDAYGLVGAASTGVCRADTCF